MMQRLSVTTSTSQRQRGFLRVTVLVGLVGLAGTGIATTHQVRARQHSHAVHTAAVKRAAEKDCGCRLPVSKSHNVSLYQTAANADGNNYEQAVSLKAGQRLALGVSDSAGSIKPGGTWDTQFGTVDANGTYTAPSFTPPEGLDYIHYLDPQGNDVFISVRILPNPTIPNSDQTPYVTFPYATGGATKAPPNDSAQAQQSPPADGSDPTFAPTSQTVVVQPGETPAAPLQINGTTPLIEETANGANVLILPATRGGGDTTSAIYALPLDETPQAVTLTPNVVPPSGPCKSGQTTSVDGPYTTKAAQQGGKVVLADIKVDAGIKADVLKQFGINLSVGYTYHVQGQYYNWSHTRIKYVYACNGKKWVLVVTLHCDGYTQSLITTPTWAIITTGFPKGNAPLLPYSPDACHP